MRDYIVYNSLGNSCIVKALDAQEASESFAALLGATVMRPGLYAAPDPSKADFAFRVQTDTVREFWIVVPSPRD